MVYRELIIYKFARMTTVKYFIYGYKSKKHPLRHYAITPLREWVGGGGGGGGGERKGDGTALLRFGELKLVSSDNREHVIPC